MKSRVPDNECEDDISLESEGAADDEQDESEALHSADPCADDISIAGTSAVTPARFYARLRTELGKRGVRYEQMPKLTEEGDSPACFAEFDVPFDLWLSQASLLGATVPYRYDMPAEPNYCHDCTAKFKRAAMRSGTCRFPHVRFERIQTVIQDGGGKIFEVETVGIGRSPQREYDDPTGDE